MDINFFSVKSLAYANEFGDRKNFEYLSYFFCSYVGRINIFNKMEDPAKKIQKFDEYLSCFLFFFFVFRGDLNLLATCCFDKIQSHKQSISIATFLANLL